MAKSTARSILCLNNLKHLGLAMHMYHVDWDCLPHMTVDSCAGGASPTTIYPVLNKIAPYVGYNNPIPPGSTNTPFEGWAKPAYTWMKGNNPFICPEQADPNIWKNTWWWNSGSYGWNPMLGPNVWWEGYGTYPSYKLSKFPEPSKKFFMADAWCGGSFNVWNFCVDLDYPSPAAPTTGSITLRHPPQRGLKGNANFVFLDGHAKAYGSPPIPFNQDTTAAMQWMSYDTPPPDGL
jgi:prepilin-type processing-associated H-X9-DG protein